MTLALAWVRRAGLHFEAVVAADSRLGSFGTWDGNPKIATLPRTDCVMAFSGMTDLAYPMMIQTQASIAAYAKSCSRYMDLGRMKGHTLAVINSMYSARPKPPGEHSPPFLILAGYSWATKSFKVWALQYSERDSEFIFRPNRNPNRNVTIIGDNRSEFAERLQKLRIDRHGDKEAPLDMEPFEVLRDMIRSPSLENRPIGGPPQLVKVYEAMTTMTFGVVWSSGDKKLATVLGRPLLGYETTSYPILDPDSLKVVSYRTLFGHGDPVPAS